MLPAKSSQICATTPTLILGAFCKLANTRMATHLHTSTAAKVHAENDSLFVQLGQRRVPLTAKYDSLWAELPLVQKFLPFQQWAQRLSNQLDTTVTGSQLEVHGVQVTDIDYFGPGCIGFVKFKADIKWIDDVDGGSNRAGTGPSVPGIVFCRGGAVAVLLIVRPLGHSRGSAVEEGLLPTQDQWVVLTMQPRVPIGALEEMALPAGMLDGDSNFSGVAAKELQEECGIQLAASDLIDLTDYRLQDEDHGIDASTLGLHPSAGGCDEFIRLFLCEKELPLEQIQALQGREGGLRSKGERIQVRLVPLQDLWRSTRDMKALAALALYQQRRQL
ncbi:hypothetical protein BSLG_006285 [Batrachochytrium salamandrivorans]|nr:hypothetical protein BASA62_003595 [Batrachochytrium salamandrivorans]KAH6573367.1 hypothetical protein BASA60_006090 [Batrachochytrium salamandrivorans]KAH9248163.1 hypothetical protein BASA81_014194 [Batrachochytrium salamandrivorans]KAJ1339147.1 hypothetical protein BSLG_006285 [Batrachochytrium salamandrivorans]